MITDNIIDRDTDGKGNSTVDSLPLHFFGKQLLSLSCNHRVTKLAKINYLGTRDALSDEPLQSQIDNLSSFLVLGTDITNISFIHQVNRWVGSSSRQAKNVSELVET